MFGARVRIPVKFAYFLVAVVSVVLLSYANTGAQSTGLGVTPQRTISLAPGKSVDSTLYVSNLNKKASVKITFSVVDFKAAGETGTPSLELNQDAKDAPWSLKPLLALPTSMELGPGESKNIPITVKVPAGQGPGSYYSAVRYDTQPTETQTVNVNASAATLVFVNVTGKVHEQMVLKQFGAYYRPIVKDSSTEAEQPDGVFKSLFIAHQPRRVALLAENEGNVAEKPAGTVEVKNMFGKQVYITNANPNQNLALIGQTRRVEACIKPVTRVVDEHGIKTNITTCDNPDLLPGMYKLHLKVSYGVGNTSKQLDTITTIWYLPVWFIVTVVLVLAIVALAITLLRAPIISYFKRRRSRKGANNQTKI